MYIIIIFYKRNMEAILLTNDHNRFSVSELNYLREAIENMSKFNQIEVLRILHKHSVMLNENKYGTHVNLSDLDDTVLEEMLTYIKYVNMQESTLSSVEQKKEDYRNTYFTKDIKENEDIKHNSFK